MILTCSQIFDKITGNMPKLPAGGRLETALKQSGLDAPATLIAIAFKESSFNKDAENDESSAEGLFQCLKGTADDIQDRVVKNFLAGAAIPNVPANGRFADHRKDADAACFCAWAYLLDRIAAKGNKLKEGIKAFGDNTEQYPKDILAEVAALRAAVGSPADKPTDMALLKKGMSDKCQAIKDAMGKAIGST